MSTARETGIQTPVNNLVPESAIAAPGSTRPRPLSGVRGHLPALDGVRGFAILAVLLFHFLTPSNPQGRLEEGVTWLVSYGALGVDLFFILSGFLITGILYDSRSDPAYFRNFYMRRVLRIFPLYYGVLVVVFFVVPAIPGLQNSEIAGLRSHQAWAWLYGVNIYLALHGGWVLSYIEHFWSLAVEEQFYFVWPFMVWLLAARRRVFLAFSLATALASFGGRIVASLSGVSPIVTTVLTPFELDALAIGGFLAVYLRDPDAAAGARRAVLPLIAAGVGLLLLQFSLRHFSESGNALLAVRSGAFHLMLTALLLMALVAPTPSAWSRFFRSSTLVTLGKYSYGLYVYHHFFSYYFAAHSIDVTLGAVIGSRLVALVILALGGIGASMAIAWLSFEYFEKYFLQLKRFWHVTPQSTARP